MENDLAEGTRGARHTGHPGAITLVLAIIAVPLAIARACGILPLTSAIIGAVLGALITMIGPLITFFWLLGMFLEHPFTLDDPGTSADPDTIWFPSLGPILTFAGGVAMLAVSIDGIGGRRGRPGLGSNLHVHAIRSPSGDIPSVVAMPPAELPATQGLGHRRILLEPD